MKHFVKEQRQTWTSKFQDYHVQSTSVRQLIQKIENHQIDMLFNKTYNRINHLILFSVQNRNK